MEEICDVGCFADTGVQSERVLMLNARCIMSQKTYDCLSRREWQLIGVKRRGDGTRPSSYELSMESRAFLVRWKCSVAVWPGKVNIQCRNCQYVADTPAVSITSLGMDAGVINFVDVLLPDMSTADLEVKLVCQDVETGKLFQEAVRFFRP